MEAELTALKTPPACNDAGKVADHRGDDDTQWGAMNNFAKEADMGGCLKDQWAHATDMGKANKAFDLENKLAAKKGELKGLESRAADQQATIAKASADLKALTDKKAEQEWELAQLEQQRNSAKQLNQQTCGNWDFKSDKADKDDYDYMFGMSKFFHKVGQQIKDVESAKNEAQERLKHLYTEGGAKDVFADAGKKLDDQYSEAFGKLTDGDGYKAALDKAGNDATQGMANDMMSNYQGAGGLDVKGAEERWKKVERAETTPMDILQDTINRRSSIEGALRELENKAAKMSGSTLATDLMKSTGLTGDGLSSQFDKTQDTLAQTMDQLIAKKEIDALKQSLETLYNTLNTGLPNELKGKKNQIQEKLKELKEKIYALLNIGPIIGQFSNVVSGAQAVAQTMRNNVIESTLEDAGLTKEILKNGIDSIQDWLETSVDPTTAISDAEKKQSASRTRRRYEFRRRGQTQRDIVECVSTVGID